MLKRLYSYIFKLSFFENSFALPLLEGLLARYVLWYRLNATSHSQVVVQEKPPQ